MLYNLTQVIKIVFLTEDKGEPILSTVRQIFRQCFHLRKLPNKDDLFQRFYDVDNTKTTKHNMDMKKATAPNNGYLR